MLITLKCCRWKSAIQTMHKNVMAYFANFVCGTEVLKAVLTQLLLYYTRLLELCKKSGPDGEALVAKDVPTIPEIMFEIKQYSIINL